MPAVTRRSRPSRFGSVVVATDFSYGADLALQRVARLPLASGARVSILHVRPRQVPARLLQIAGGIVDHRLDRAVALLTEWARGAGRTDLRISGDLAVGTDFVEILRHARRRKADLIVLGRHGQGRMRDLVLGTTAQRVVRKSPVPVLVVNREARAPYRRPVVAVDLAVGSSAVCAAAARILDPVVPSVHLVHAYEVPFAGWLALSTRHPGIERRTVYRDRAARELRRLATSLASVPPPFRTRVRYGDPRAVILSELQRRRADLVVLGTHGRRGLARALLGTVAEGVVAGATCDVLTVRPPGVSIRLP